MSNLFSWRNLHEWGACPLTAMLTGGGTLSFADKIDKGLYYETFVGHDINCLLPAQGERSKPSNYEDFCLVF
jgi:hypothetical protein